MPVNLDPPRPEALRPVAGIRLGVARAGIRKAGRKDLLLMALDEGTQVAGVFTRNRFCAAPVVLARASLKDGEAVRALLVNTGNANAGTGEQGLIDARRACSEAAKLLGVGARAVLPFSTGVIMEPLPVERIAAALPACFADLHADNWLSAAEAIMTTDTVAKGASRKLRLADAEVTVTGIAKGAGMIHPNMATMLCFMATDAACSPHALHAILTHACQASFNSITVDGDTSTNDSFILAATGRAGNRSIASIEDRDFPALQAAVTEVAEQLAQAIVRDGEGATKFVTVRVEQGADSEECRRVAYAIAHSPLVKTAFFASDPNLGRILAAIGYAGIEDLDVARVDLFLDDVHVASQGGRNPSYREEDGRRVLARSEFAVRVVLHRGSAVASVWTCDLSHEYVRINAEYRT